MDDADDGPYAREPQLDDLVRLARSLNAHDVLMAKACGVDYADASRDAVEMLFAGIPILVASPRTLIRTKNTIRPSDAADRQFLQVLVDEVERR